MFILICLTTGCTSNPTLNGIIIEEFNRVLLNSNTFNNLYNVVNNKLPERKNTYRMRRPFINNRVVPNYKSLDYKFYKWSKHYNSPVKWELIKALCTAESGLNNKAVSSSGAVGICQVLPSTFNDIKKRTRLPNNANIKNIDHNISASVLYIKYLYSQWSNPRTELARLKLTIASYNSGLGNVLKAQHKCNNVSTYDGIIRCLPMVTGNRSIETTTHVKKVMYITRNLTS